MNKLCTLIFLAATISVQAQRFNSALFGQDVPCTLIMKSTWEKKEVTVTYQHPFFLKQPEQALISKDGPILKSALEAFVIDGNTWALRRTSMYGDQWVAIDFMGALDQFTFINIGSDTKPSDIKNSTQVITGTLTVNRSTGESMSNTEVLFGYKKKMPKLVADNQELANKVATDASYGWSNIGKVIKEYNFWYETNNPGKLKYLPGFESQDPNKKEAEQASIKGFGDLKDKIKANQEKSKAEGQKRLDSLFSGRTATPSPDVASAKDNIPVKKETFAAKMQRIKADGNKMGIIVNIHSIKAAAKKKAGGSSTMMQQQGMGEEIIPVEGEFTDESLTPIAKEFTDELTKALNTTDIEFINIEKIPYREVKVFGANTRIDDWWATKYKVIFALDVDPRVKATHETFGNDVKFAGRLDFICSLIVTEYIGGPTSDKRDIITQVLNMGSFSSSFSQKEDVGDLKTLYDKLVSRVGMPLIDKARTERADGVKKLVEKKLN
ncbi:hypothetical protein WSM22_15710 [Cytophagales bacterium WSM2-2]|nr:hypothetical protein WSM22_15710 [Cytophagales bacterium WSM2-2]